jgi:hypothetical protein
MRRIAMELMTVAVLGGALSCAVGGRDKVLGPVGAVEEAVIGAMVGGAPRLGPVAIDVLYGTDRSRGRPRMGATEAVSPWVPSG